MSATETTRATETYVGQSLPRKEDYRLITGGALFTDDIVRPGMVWAALVRSPFANAQIKEIDLKPALDQPGVLAAFTGQELRDEWMSTLPCAWPVNDEMLMPDHWPLTPDKARHVGDGVAVVVANSRAAAKDGAEAVFVDYEPFPAVVDAEAALDDQAPLVHDDLDTNRCYTWRLEAGDHDAVFAQADVTIKERYRQQRLIACAMEPRGVVCEPTGMDEYTLWTSTQMPHIVRTALAETTGVAESKLRVIAPDVGGGFGAKGQVYAEEALCLALARRLGKPVKWIDERSSDHLTTHHARNLVQHVELAATAEGKLQGIRVKVTADLGAYLGLNGPGIPLLGGSLYCGCYHFDAYDFQCEGVFTHTTMVDGYRGAGRPEAAYGIERSIDALARKIGKDPIEIRRLNFIKEFPAELVTGMEVDAGDFDALMDRTLEMLDLEAVRAEQSQKREANDVHQVGVGFSSFIEMAGFAPSRILGEANYKTGGWEAATIRCMPTGGVQVVTGASPHGQGHETTFAQVVADALGVDPAKVELIHGDTASSSLGIGTFASRSMVVGGVAIYHAAQRVVAKARTIASHQLEVAEDDLVFAEGEFTVKGTDRTISLDEVAYAAWQGHDLPDGLEPGLEGSMVFDPANYTWPSGAYAAVVDVDLETGAVDLRRMVAVDDVGVVVNPQIVEGQAHGALAQGIAQALWEEGIYDDDGNLLTGSFMNYALPSAVELPWFEIDRTVTACPGNPLGAKGAGETGTIGSPPAVVNAVIDALAPLGVQHLDMPLTPESVWRAIEEARE